MMNASVTAPLRNLLRFCGLDAYRVGRFGVRIHRAATTVQYPPDFDTRIASTIRQVQPYTMTLPAAVYNLCRATRYVVQQNIEGALVECGVWKGGSSMAMAIELLRLGVRDRDIYLYDTFDGMVEPTDEDVTYNDLTARQRLEQLARAGTAMNEWSNSPLESVKLAMKGTGYPQERIHFVQGPVETTLQEGVPDKIAILRLDTDWYESTKAEMSFLFPRLSRGGVLLVDDYGSWKGAAKAVDEYFVDHNITCFLTRVTAGLYMGTKQ